MLPDAGHSLLAKGGKLFITNDVDRAGAVHAHSRGNHYALMIDDMDAWEAYFREQGIEYLPRRTRPDGAYQIYVADPDGHMIELCTPAGPAERSKE